MNWLKLLAGILILLLLPIAAPAAESNTCLPGEKRGFAGLWPRPDLLPLLEGSRFTTSNRDADRSVPCGMATGEEADAIELLIALRRRLRQAHIEEIRKLLSTKRSIPRSAPVPEEFILRLREKDGAVQEQVLGWLSALSQANGARFKSWLEAEYQDLVTSPERFARWARSHDRFFHISKDLSEVLLKGGRINVNALRRQRRVRQGSLQGPVMETASMPARKDDELYYVIYREPDGGKYRMRLGIVPDSPLTFNPWGNRNHNIISQGRRVEFSGTLPLTAEWIPAAADLDSGHYMRRRNAEITRWLKKTSREASVPIEELYTLVKERDEARLLHLLQDELGLNFASPPLYGKHVFVRYEDWREARDVYAGGDFLPMIEKKKRLRRPGP